MFQLSIFILASQRSPWVVRLFAGLWKFCGVGADEEDALVEREAWTNDSKVRMKGGCRCGFGDYFSLRAVGGGGGGGWFGLL